MTSDGKRKDDPKLPDDAFGEEDLDGWADAIDEWDPGFDALEMNEGQEQPAPSPATGAAPAVQPGASGEAVDPLVNFIQGDMEIPEEEEGHALGSLLGSAAAEQPLPPPDPAGDPGEPVMDIGITPDEVVQVDAEVEVSRKGWLDSVQSSFSGQEEPTPVHLPAAVDEEATPVRFVESEGAAEVEPPPAPVAEAGPRPSVRPIPHEDAEHAMMMEPPAAGVTKSVEPADFDLGDLMGDLGVSPAAGPLSVPPPPGPKTPVAAPPPVAPPTPSSVLEDLNEASEEEGPSTSSLFDELVSIPDEPDGFEEIEAGEVLPRSPADTDDLEEAPLDLDPADLAEPELQPPPIPETLTTIDFSSFDMPEQGVPIAPPRLYWERLSDHLQLEAGLAETTSRAAELESTIARACEEIGEIDEAISHYREVLDHVPGNVPAMNALRRLWTARQEPSLVAEILGDMIDRVDDREGQALRSTKAELLWCTTGDDDGAREQISAQTGPGNPTLRALLIQADLAAATADGEELSDAVEAIARIVEDPALKAVYMVDHARQAEIAGKHEDAREAYRGALSFTPGSHAALEGLLRSAARLEDHDLMVEALSMTPDGMGIWGARRLRRAATLASNHGIQGTDPITLLRKAREMDSEDPLVLEELARALRKSGEAEEALETFATLGQTVTDPVQRALALAEAAQIAEEKLTDPVRALELYERSATLLPDSAALQINIQRIKEERPEPEQRLEAHQAAAHAYVGASRAVHHLEAATILEAELDQQEDARSELLECLEHDPTCQAALGRLARIYRKNGQLEQFAAVLDTAATVADSSLETAGLRMEAALLYEGILGEPAKALERYRQILEVDSGHISARLGQLRCLAHLKDWDTLSREVSSEAMLVDEAERAASLWIISGDLLRKNGQGEEAEACYKLAQDKAPGMLSATWNLIQNHAGADRWDQVAALWSSRIDLLDEGVPERKGLLMRLASLQEFELDDPSAAMATYELAAVEPNPAPGSVDGLLRVLRRMESNDRLVHELERELTLTTDPASRFSILVAAGELACKAGIDWSEAEEKFRRALEEVPDAPIARLALVQLYMDQMAWQPLTDLLRGSLKEDGDAADRVATRQRMVQIDIARGDEESAQENFQAILEDDPGNLAALRFLQRLHLREDRQADLLRCLHDETVATEDRSDAASLWLELARLLSREQVEQEEQEESQESEAPPCSAEQAFGEVLDRVDGSFIALRHLIAEAAAAHDREAMAEYYRTLTAAVENDQEAAIYLLRAGEIWQDSDLSCLAEAIQRHPDDLPAIYRLVEAALRLEDWGLAATAAEASARSSCLAEHRSAAALLAGEIALLRLEDEERAMAAFEQVLEASPEDRFAFGQLEAFLERRERWDELVQLLTNRAKIERSRPRLLELHQRLASINKDRLDDRDRAKKHLHIVLKLSKEDPAALATLAELHGADGEWEESASALMRIARQESSPEVLSKLFFRLGDIYDVQNPNRARAIACFRKVYALDPGDTAALERLSALYLEDLDFDNALETSTQLLEGETNPQQRVIRLLKIARIHEDGFKDPHRSAIAYRQAIEIDPTDLDAIGEVIGFFVRQGDQRSLMIHLDRSVATMRKLLLKDPYMAFPYQALYKIFGWRKAPDGRYCAAQVLDSLGECSQEEQQFLVKHHDVIGVPGPAMNDPECNEKTFTGKIPGGFKQVFKLLADSFSKSYPGNIKHHGATRGDRVIKVDHPLRRIGDKMAKDLGVGNYDVYILKSKPDALIVENTNPPSVLVGKGLLHEATAEEILFIMGRSLWIIQRAMILPACLRPGELELLVAGIVRQYNPDFQPEESDEKSLIDTTKKVKKSIPRKLQQELMPFALECSGSSAMLRGLRPAVINSANRAGLLTSRSTNAALNLLCKMAGHARPPQDPAERARLLRGNEEAEELLRFAVSDDHFELRRSMLVGIR